MIDLAVGLGLVLVLEGLLWSLFPHTATRLLALAAAAPETRLRMSGVAAVVVGVLIVWLVRG